MSKINILCAFAIVIGLVACKGDGQSSSGLATMDLMQYGMPIKIKAPADAKVEADDMGIMKDVTVQGADNFFLQVTSGVAMNPDAGAVKADQLQGVKNARFFEELVQEDPHGFIYKKKISEDRINYDFRYVKIQADQEYIFQTGLMGKYSLEDVQRMYNAVKS